MAVSDIYKLGVYPKRCYNCSGQKYIRMTAEEITPLIESQLINSLRSNTVKVVLAGGSIACGEFLKLLLEDSDMLENKMAVHHRRASVAAGWGQDRIDCPGIEERCEPTSVFIETLYPRFDEWLYRSPVSP